MKLAPKGFTKISISDELKDQLKSTSEAEGLTMPDLIRKMLGKQYPEHPVPEGARKKWWLISDKDVQTIRTGLTARTDTRRRHSHALHALDSGLHETEAIPADWKE